MGDRVYKDIIGIVGGMGSFSTLYLFKEILNSFSMIEDSERPRIIIDNYCNIPNKIDACLFSDKKEPFLSCLSASVTNLIKLGCTKIIIACNITHVLLDDLFAIHPHFKKYIINMMDIILRRLRVNDVNKAYLFATNNAIQSKVFHKYLENVELKSLEDKIDYEEISGQCLEKDPRAIEEFNAIKNHLESKLQEKEFEISDLDLDDRKFSSAKSNQLVLRKNISNNKI